MAGTGQDNFYNSGSAKVDTDGFDLRLDYNVTPRQSVFGRLSCRRSFDGPPRLFPGETGMATDLLPLFSNGGNTSYHALQVTVSKRLAGA